MKKKLLSLRLQSLKNNTKAFTSLVIFLLILSSPAKSQVKDVVVPKSQVKLIKTFKIHSNAVEAPTVVDPNALYSDISTFSGSATTNGAANLLNGNTITTLIADSLGLIGTPPFSIGGFTFSVANFNGVNVSARPLIRFYANDGTAGGPGTILAAYDFAPISFSALNVALFTGNVTPFTATTQSIWAAIIFDNETATTGATLAQLNNLGQGVFDPIDRGSSTDGFFATDTAGAFEANNPTGSVFDFGGPPLANFAWEIISAVPLPVTLNSFKVQRVGLINSLTWNTSQELNSKYFSVEHSIDGVHFNSIGEVKAAGNSSVALTYRLDDKNPGKGINYYRLRLVDIDDSGKYSSIVTVRNSGTTGFTIYPNPVKTTMLIDMDAEKAGNAYVNITGMDGRIVYNRQVSLIQGNNNFSINLGNFSKGTYTIRVQSGSSVYTQKFSKL